MRFRLTSVGVLFVASLLCALGADAPKQDLHHNMESMEGPFKKLQSQVKDSGKNESSLALVVQLQQLTLASKDQLPRMVSKMPTTQQAEEKTNYRQMMVNLLRHELDL